MIEKAGIADPPRIVEIVRIWAEQEAMLPRPLNSVYECLRDFYVWREDGNILGCAALHICWQGLAEIRSVAIDPVAKATGIGTKLAQACLDEARAFGVPRVFILTYVPEFFARFGFEICDKDTLPHKVWADCINCPKFPDCDEIAMTLDMG